MRKLHILKSILAGGASAAVLAATAHAAEFNIPGGELATALDRYSKQTGVALLVSGEALRGVKTRGVRGDLAADVALSRILSGTGFTERRDPSGLVGIVHQIEAPVRELAPSAPMRMAESSSEAASGIESVVVTSSKIKGDIQTVPIAITALSQEQLTARQIAGGPDLVKEVPNLTFSKTNFSGYNIQIRGIGTQAISVTTDPAVAVAFNDTPFIRNHFFEQEFYDVSQVEVLRGPQGTLYGRNATAGVVNVVSAKSTDQFEAMLSADWGNYYNRRYEGMVNIPIAGDKLDLRVAGEWTKRDGYTFNQTTGSQTDGRDLWSSRVTLGWKPVSDVQSYLIWEHFSEDDDRLRSGKQLCKTDPGPSSFIASDGSTVPVAPAGGNVFIVSDAYFSQGCLPTSMYSKDAFEVPNGFSLPFVSGAAYLGLLGGGDPYASTIQSTNLHDIQSVLQPKYRAKNDTLEFDASWNITPALTLSSDTGYNNDFLWSTEDYNRFDTAPGLFGGTVICDPQLGCSDRLVVQDLSTERAWQASQEFRLTSNFEGPLNFSVGGNFLHYETLEKYYVFSNTFTIISLDNYGCDHVFSPGLTNLGCLYNGREYNTPAYGGGVPTESPQAIDPNPITNLSDDGHNYFLSKNPYVLNSYAGFGEAYYSLTDELKLTAGLRWTDDQKHIIEIPSELISQGYGYASTGTVDQAWHEWTGRFVGNWSPKLTFTDQSLFYASYSRGYKAGGANPPGAVLVNADTCCFDHSVNINFPTHPLTFKPEFIDAYELGTKNTLLDGALTLNGDVFFYNYKGYQISQIVDRTSVNLNFDATVKGAELEATYEPLPGLKFSFAGGYEDTRINDNQYAIDLTDRTAGHPGWVLMKPSVGQSSNCIFPEYVAAALVTGFTIYGEGNPAVSACGVAYTGGLDPITGLPYVPNPPFNSHPSDNSGGFIPPGYPGFDPLSVDPNVNPATVNGGLGLPPNNGEGFVKSVGGNQLPNAPHYTVSLTGDYTMPVSANWAATLHSDFYWQSQSFGRVFNDRPYDKIRGYSTTNLALILTDASGWQVMGYVKNIFDVTAITGDFLNSDDSGLTTNIFLTDPRLYGVRVTKHFDDGDAPGGGFDLFSNNDADNKRPQIWLTLGGNLAMMGPSHQPYVPAFAALMGSDLPTPAQIEKTPTTRLDWNASLSYQPEDSDWVLKANIRYGRSSIDKHTHKSLPKTIHSGYALFEGKFVDGRANSSEPHSILDFTLGKDVGLGLLGNGGQGVLSAGVKVAQFDAHTFANINSDPNYLFKSFKYRFHDVFNGSTQEKRRFHGIGPEITWDATASLFGDSENGIVVFDWGLNAAALFGRQTASIQHATYGKCYGNKCAALNPVPPYSVSPPAIKRSRNVTVPNLGGYAGLSVKYSNAKVSFGYRADEFFGAMDGGQATARKYNRGFFGPFLNLSVGFGG